MGKSPYLILPLSGRQNQVLATWYNIMKKEHPRCAAVYARAAIEYYIHNKTYLMIGSVSPVPMGDNEKIPKLSIYKNDVLMDWIDKLCETHMSAGPIATAILRKSIEVRTDGTYAIPDLIDVIEHISAPSLDNAGTQHNSIMPEKVECIETELTPEKESASLGLEASEVAVEEETSSPPAIAAPIEKEAQAIPPENKSNNKRIMSNFGAKFV